MRPATMMISGRHMMNAIVERRRISRARPRLRNPRREALPARTGVQPRSTASTMERSFRWAQTACPLRARGVSSFRRRRSGAQRAFELLLGPLDHVIESLATLRKLRDHDGVDRLVVNLSTNVGTRRRTRDRRHLVSARRIGIDR